MQAKLHLSFHEEALGFNGPFLVHAQLAAVDQLGGNSLVQPSQPLRASGCGQSKQKGRQQASAALLELLLQVRSAVGYLRGSRWLGLMLCCAGPCSACCHCLQCQHARMHAPFSVHAIQRAFALACIGIPAGIPAGDRRLVAQRATSSRAARPQYL